MEQHPQAQTSESFESPTLPPGQEQEEATTRSFRRLGRRTPPTSPEASSAPTDETIGGRLAIFVTEIGELAGGSRSPMASMLKMVGPRIAGDVAAIPEEQLESYMDQLLARLTFVRFGHQAPEVATDDDPRSLGVTSALALVAPAVSTEG